MADHKPKELYWFRYEPKRYLTGKIQYCSLEAQGLFANIQCFYWQRECEMSCIDLSKKFGSQEKLIDELIHEGIIKLENGMIYIDFLDDQYEPQRIIKEKLSAGGRKGAKTAHANRKRNKEIAEGAPIKLFPETDDLKGKELAHEGKFFYIGMRKYSSMISDYCKEEMQEAMNVYLLKHKPITQEQALTEMDSKYPVGYKFNNHNHVMLSFNKVASELNKAPGTKFEAKTDAKASIVQRPNTDK